MKYWKVIERMFVGRITRLQFLQALFFGWLLPTAAYIVLLVLSLHLLSGTNISGAVFFLLFFVPLAVSALVLCGIHVRRLHDMGMPGWYTLIPLVREVSFVVGFFLPGKNEPNRYGLPPEKRSLVRTIFNASASVEDKGEKWLAVLFAGIAVFTLLFSLFVVYADKQIQEGYEEERKARILPQGALPSENFASIEDALLAYLRIHDYDCESVPDTDYTVEYEEDFIPNYGRTDYIIGIWASCDGVLAGAGGNMPFLVLSESEGKYHFVGNLNGELPFVEDPEPDDENGVPDIVVIGDDAPPGNYDIGEWEWRAEFGKYLEQSLSNAEKAALLEQYQMRALQHWNDNVE